MAWYAGLLGFLDGIIGNIIAELIVVIVVAVVGFIYRNAVLARLRGTFMWVFNYEIPITAFTVYMGLGAHDDVDRCSAELITSLRKKGYSIENIQPTGQVNMSLLVTKDRLSFKFGLMEIPEAVEGSSFKIRIDAVNGTVTFRTGIDKLQTAMSEIVNVVNSAFGGGALNVNYMFEVPHSFGKMSASYIRKRNWKESNLSITERGIRSEQKTLGIAIKLLRMIIANPKIVFS